MHADQIAEIRRYIEFLNRGREEANALFREMLALPSERWDDWLAGHPAALSVPLFHVLLRHARRLIGDREQNHGLALTELVTRHVDAVTVPPEAELALDSLKRKAWSTHARALLSAGRLEEALHVTEMDQDLLVPWDQPPATEDDIRRVEELIEKYGLHHLREPS
ncbi:MAG: hypothetical protein DMF56_27265 [Acidobacteria bacterium]|nr:MAG: hypothetical protein DMF56_27265 [Acidobacteriota bacterium]